MKLKFPLLDELIDIVGASILAVEDVRVFAKLTQQCYQYEEASELRLFDSYLKTLKETELMLVTDVLGYDLNSATILKRIHADLEAQFNDKPELKSKIDQMLATITDWIAHECLEHELDLEYRDISILELIKALGVKVQTQPKTIFEKCLDILQIFKYLSKKKLLILVNSGAFLSREELSSLLEYISLSNLTVLFLEPRQLYDFPQYVLDTDYFLTAQNML